MGGGEGRLILGYDGGCGACGDLAKRIEEKVGENLEVLSLHDSRMEQWREKSLGKDAPWAPTLVEVGDGGEVRAWTGAGMAVKLSRTLGIVYTWRIMQAFDGAIRTPKAEHPRSPKNSDSIGRRQFLKSLGGMAAAVSVLYMGAVASPAEAQSISVGTRVQRQQVTSIIRASAQYKRLVSRLGKNLDFGRAEFKISESQSLASVAARTNSRRGTAVVALFFVDLRTKTIQYHRYATLTPKEDVDQSVANADAVEIVAYEDGLAINKVSLNENHVTTMSGRKLSLEQFQIESEGSPQESSFQEPVRSLARTCRPGHKRCRRNRYRFCLYSTSGLCLIARYFGVGGQVACLLYPNKKSGCAAIARVSCYRDYCR